MKMIIAAISAVLALQVVSGRPLLEEKLSAEKEEAKADVRNHSPAKIGQGTRSERESLMAWPTEEKRSDDDPTELTEPTEPTDPTEPTGEPKSREKRVFCSPFHGCRTIEDDGGESLWESLLEMQRFTDDLDTDGDGLVSHEEAMDLITNYEYYAAKYGPGS